VGSFRKGFQERIGGIDDRRVFIASSLVGMGTDDGGAIGCLHFRCRDRGLGLQSENLAGEFRRGGVAFQDSPPGRRIRDLLPMLLRLGRCDRLRWACGKGAVPGGAVNAPLPAPFEPPPV